MIRNISILISCVIAITSCNKSPSEKHQEEVLVMTAQDEPRISSEFIKFDKNEGDGRCADFTLENKTDYKVVGVRGTVVGYNQKNEKVYEFPWSQVRRPILTEPQSNAVIEDAGFKIPDEVTKVEYILEEFDLIK